MKTVLTLLFSGICVSLFSQADTAFLANSRAAALKKYTETITTHSTLFQGRAYKEYEPVKEEHPYFVREWSSGSVVHEGEQFENVSLHFDLSIDQLIVENPYTGEAIQLAKEKVGRFTLGPERFVKMYGNGLTGGFYHEIYYGKSQVLERTEKVFQKRVYGKVVEFEFTSKTSHYVFTNGIYRSVKSKRVLLGLFEDKKSDLKKFMKESQINFRQNRGKSIGLVAAFYDKLKG